MADAINIAGKERLRMNKEKIEPEVLKILGKIQKRGKSIQRLWKENKKDLDRLREIEQAESNNP